MIEHDVDVIAPPEIDITAGRDSGAVVFGPAARRMPQLPIGVDAEGFLVARADFAEPVGPSFWERG